MKIQVINKSKHALPEYATGQSAGMDIRANLDEPIVLKPLQRCLVPTGLYIALPEGFEAQIRPRSGLAIKKGIGVLNSPGTIDADYRGEICIILVNLSSEDFMIDVGPVHRSVGSMGANTDPSRVFPGKKMAGHLGCEQVTIQNLDIAKVDKELNLIAIRGAVPGPKGGIVFIKNTVKA